MKLFHFFSFVSIIYLLNSCASIPVATMQPINTETTYNWGKEVVSMNKNEVYINVAFLRSTDAYFLFEIELQNASGKTILASPETFFYQVMLADTLEPLGNRFPAVNPEIKLLEINKAEARENADSKTSYLLEFTSAVTNTVSDLSNINEQRTQEEIDKEEEEREERRNDYEMEEIERSLTFQSLNEKRDFWQNKVFRKTHIPHGYSLKGQVAFNRFNNKQPYLKFNFQVESENFEVIYQQKLIHPDSPSQ